MSRAAVSAASGRAPLRQPPRPLTTKSLRKRERESEETRLKLCLPPRARPNREMIFHFFGNHTFLLIDAFDLYVPTNQDLVAIKIELVKST